MKPYRSKAFLSFVHRERRGGKCVACGEQRWEELHHFGDDGGMGMKPSDHLVVRLCKTCHNKPIYGAKLRALRTKGHEEVAADYLRDAAQSILLWSVNLEERLGEYQDNGCARDELIEWLTDYDGRDLEAAEAWLLAWAHRRHLNALAGMREALTEVLKADDLEAARFVASRALEAW